MCLTVVKNFMSNPLNGKACFKELKWDASRQRWVTPYQYSPVEAKNGHFVAKNPSRRKTNFSKWENIEGGFLHVYKGNPGYCVPMTEYRKGKYDFEIAVFKAVAYDVVAEGNNGDMVCRKLYIPAFDKRKNGKCAW